MIKDDFNSSFEKKSIFMAIQKCKLCQNLMLDTLNAFDLNEFD